MSEVLFVDTRETVETPEGVDFQFRLSGPGPRAIAWLLDTLLKAAILILIVILLSFASIIDPGIAEGAGLVLSFFVSWIYVSLFEAFWSGQTPGKRLMSLRVVRTNGTPIGVFEAFGRNFLRAIDFLPFFYTVGLISMLSTRRLQRLGDLIFDTMVINEHRQSARRSIYATRDIPPITRQECRGRFVVPERTVSVIERLFEVDRVISHARREEIAELLGKRLQQRMGVDGFDADEWNPSMRRGLSVRYTTLLRRILKTFDDDQPEQNPQDRNPYKSAPQAYTTAQR